MTVELEYPASDIMSAMDELAALSNGRLTPGDVNSALVELCKATPGRNPESVDDQAWAVAELAQAMRGEPSREFEVALSRQQGRDYGRDEIELTAGYGDEDYLGLSVTQAERDQAHAAGNSLPDKSYPVQTVRQLHAAAHLAATGHGDVEGAKRLIRRRAKELGVPLHSLEGFEDEDDSHEDDSASNASRKMAATLAQVDKLTNGLGTGYVRLTRDSEGEVCLTGGEDDAQSELYRLTHSGHTAGFFSGPVGLAVQDADHPMHFGAGQGSADDILARHAEREAERKRRVQRSKRARAALHRRPGTVRLAAGDGAGHTEDCDPDCVTDHKVSPKGGQGWQDDEIDRLMRANPAYFAKEAPAGSYSPGGASIGSMTPAGFPQWP